MLTLQLSNHFLRTLNHRVQAFKGCSMSQRGEHADLEPVDKVEWAQEFDFVIIGPNNDFLSSPPAIIEMIQAVGREGCTFLIICWGFGRYKNHQRSQMTRAVPEHTLIFPEHGDFRERLDFGHDSSAYTTLLAHDLLETGVLRLVDAG